MGIFNHISLLFKHYITDKTGSLIPLTAVMMPLLVGMTGVGLDVSKWISERRDLQTAADAAVIAAAWEIANDFDDYAEYSAMKEAANNGFDATAAGSVLDLQIGADDQGRTTITATLEQRSETYFSKVLYHGDVYTAAAASSAVIEPAGDFCLLSLDEEQDGAITTVGNVTVNSPGCGMAINSNSDKALSVSGNVDITMNNFSIVGDYDIFGGSANLNYKHMNTNATKTPDPYEDLEVPHYKGCDYNNFKVTKDATLKPGVYCGGISVSGNADIDFAPGVYILDGGDFSVRGGGSLTGTEVSFVLTSSKGNKYGRLDIAGGKHLMFTGPAEGDDMQGVVVYRDRNAPEASGNQCSKMTGTSAIEVQGAVYMPTDCMRIGGNHDSSSSLANPCTRIIAKTIKLHGNPTMDNNCEGVPVEDITQIAVKLVM